MTGAEFNASNTNLKIVKTEMKPSGEAVQLVRPLAHGNKTSDEIVDELVHRFNYKTSEVKSAENELNTVQQAFGSNLADELITTYEGSNLVSDSQQDLVGERYLAEQIRLIQEQQKASSFLDKWSHLLYEGERDYKSSAKLKTSTFLDVGSGEVATSEHAQASASTSASANASSSAAVLAQLQQQLLQDSNSYFNLQSQQEQQQDSDAVLRSSASRNSVASNNLQQVPSQNAAVSYANSHSGIQSRTLSEIRLQPYSEAALSASASAAATAQSQAQFQASQFSRALQESALQSRLSSQLAQHQTQQDEILAYAQAQALAVQQQHEAPVPQAFSSSRQSSGGNVHSRSTGARTAISQASSHRTVAAASASASASAAVSSAAAASAAANTEFQQPQPYLPQLSGSNLNSVSLEAYNSPQFKAMLEQLSKPISIPPEQINYPPDWPSQDKINLLAEPIYIPAPLPIVIPAPSIITMNEQLSLKDPFSRQDLPEAALKPTITYYPSIANDQAQYSNFGIRQINTNI